ncbi:ExeM/NucH family extracellular endonuclease [Vibrio mangrovi]|uniref:Endonuclease/Exonuclease/phosphatase family protein n=1 Tax=Vibrio mangrovi TaxID=474394 RepID=A0A1Y6J1B5_9VIBR|nr:ExeM/NucH family extracellular endonuclease [Vibrio mangrovi]MDW6005329.1 ExeM/NucH family extracellular endonuclease [Vibrio mangrovi]SMS03041.1 Endonuclease/Exonuclease/phosphatase family protein [Vibrio mangrovi]
MKLKSSLSYLSIVIGSTLSLSAHADIILSQYVEGSGLNKAIEIANTGDASVSLDGYALAKSTNGSGAWENQLPLDGRTIPAHGVFVIANSQASSEILALSNETDNTVVNFNGNDPIALLLNGSEHDVIGAMGGSYFAKDVTLSRLADSLTPSSTYIAAQWTTAAANNIDGLGSLDSTVSTFTCEGESFTPIQEIQGEGSRSPLLSGSANTTDGEYAVQGVVSAVTTGLTKGFYLQALENDYNDNTSEGLFIYTGQSASDLQPGDVVCAKGKVSEYYNLTELLADNRQWVKLGEQAAPQATDIVPLESDDNFAQTLERYEGMLVNLPQNLDMRVTRTFSYDYDARRNNMVLAQGRLNTQPNQNFAAGSEQARQQSEENAQHRLFIESDQVADNGAIPYYPQFGRSDIDQDGSTEDYIRVNDTLSGAEGVLTYSYGDYRLIMTNTLTQDNFVHNSPRQSAPQLQQGNLRIATFNVLNYFNSPFGGDANPYGSNRGAKSDAEFEIQQEKIVRAILKLDADIIGLMEIENNGFGDGGAIHQLVEQLNLNIAEPENRYHYVAIDSNQDGEIDARDTVGTDAITTGIIYRSQAVTLATPRVIHMPSQQAPEVFDKDGNMIEDGKNYQRETLAPTFKVRANSGKEQELTVAVNHFKSKGSTCWEDAAAVADGGQGQQDADFQGSCENFRVAAAVALGEALKEIPGHQVILGDLNAYGKEDPLLVLTDYTPEKYGKTIHAARNTVINGETQFGDQGADITHGYGYLSALNMIHPDNWSYSYNDEVGSLDHILISPSLKTYVVDATDWHINAAESPLFDYTNKYKGDLPRYHDQYRASDHDPAVLELEMGGSVGGMLLVSLFGLLAIRRKA